MSVVHGTHGVHKDGDFSSFGDMGGGSGSSSGPNDDSGINSNGYHFHRRIQELEDGIYEQFKEQNKNFNKDREIEVSSITPAMYRKLMTTMISPVLINILLVVALLLLNPLLYSIDSTKKYFVYAFIFTGMILYFNMLFDAYVIYKMRRYVIEKVTNKYYVTIKKAWKSFEILFFLLSIAVFVVSMYLLVNPIDLQSLTTHKILTKILGYIVFENYLTASAVSSLLSIIIYLVFVKFIDLSARKDQKTAIIESRKGSEHNADVAEDIMSGRLNEFEDSIIK